MDSLSLRQLTHHPGPTSPRTERNRPWKGLRMLTLCPHCTEQEVGGGHGPEGQGQERGDRKNWTHTGGLLLGRVPAKPHER